MGKKMLKGQSLYPVGAIWVARGSQGRATIYLKQRSFAFGKCHEVWKWTWRHPDGSGYEGDWGPTRRSVKDQCYSVDKHGEKRTRFKRVKESPHA